MKIITALALFLVMTASAMAETIKESESVVPIYQMDLFSIVSFSLAIAALLLSGFMAWLSWELFKKSSETSEKTQQVARMK